MHVLASHYDKEFKSALELVRFDYPIGGEKREPTLLIKTKTLLLKYIVSGAKLQLFFFMIENRLVYTIGIWDDNEHPAYLWSVLKRQEEKDALLGLAKGDYCQIFLFNELSVNIAQKVVFIEKNPELCDLINNCTIGAVDQSKFQKRVSEILDMNSKIILDGNVLIDIPNEDTWQEIFSTYVTNKIKPIRINIFNQDESRQQEELLVWLIDNLHPLGVYHSPQIPKGSGSREFTDALLTYNNGSFLIESKALTIFNRNILPDRLTLSGDITKHIEKAIGQLKGAVRQIKLGTCIKTISGETIEIEREKPAHCIILIPDMELISNSENLGLNTIQDFMEKTNSYIHLVDISELVRIVQAASMISSNSKSVTKIMAFDYYLLKRAKIAVNAKTLCVNVLLKMDTQ
jgi:hypothetical protein